MINKIKYEIGLRQYATIGLRQYATSHASKIIGPFDTWEDCAEAFWIMTQHTRKYYQAYWNEITRSANCIVEPPSEDLLRCISLIKNIRAADLMQ